MRSEVTESHTFKYLVKQPLIGDIFYRGMLQILAEFKYPTPDRRIREFNTDSYA